MGLKDALLGKKEGEVLEFPEDDSIGAESEDDVIAFVKQRNQEKKAAELAKAQKLVQKPVVKLVEVVKEEPKPVPFPFEEPVKEEAPPEPKTNSALSHQLFLELNSNNLAPAGLLIEEALETGYVLQMQTGIIVNLDNLDKLKKLFKWLVENDFKIIVSGEKIERVLNE